MSLWDSFLPARDNAADGAVLTGTARSGGIFTGTARVLDDPDAFGTFEPGDILVAPITTPAFTPLFALASGVVTDIGGILSHSSIVAREYGIPAVLGTGTATRRIRSGDTITVDGDHGRVLLTDAASTATPEAERSRTPWVVAGLAAAAVAGIVLPRRGRFGR